MSRNTSFTARIGTRLPSRSDVTVATVLSSLVTVFAVSFTLLTIYYAYALPFSEPTQYANIFLGIGMVLYYLLQASEALGEDPFIGNRLDTYVADGSPLRSIGGRVVPSVAVFLAGASLLATGYVHLNFGRLQAAYTVGYTTADILIGLLIILLVTDATRRAFGYMFTSVVIFSLVYAFVGPLLPGFFNHSGMSLERIAREGAIGLQGTYGFILEIGSTWVAIFIMFAGIAKAYGALDYVLEVGREAGKSLRTGVVQVAVVASMIMGSITGSAAANTATTGSFTIPMIKDQGIRDDFAAAIEAVASAGGQMLPPVMGVAAFLMADILGIEYLTVVRAGVIPAALFYLSVGVAVYLIVLKFGWTTDELEPFDRSVLLNGLHFLVPLGTLLYTLVVLRYTPLGAGLYSIGALVGVMYIRRIALWVRDGTPRTAFDAGSSRRDGVPGTVLGVVWLIGSSARAALETTRRTLDGFRQGAIEMAPLVGILGSLGLILQMIQGTGLSGKISQQMVSLAGGVLVLLLIMAMLASILFGLGMPTPAAYILVAMLIVPSITAMDVADITAHMFVFYFAMLSAITPPVAVSVAIGSSIAGASFTKSCLQSIRIGAPGFVIPFAFVANNSLIYWSVPDTLIAFPVALAGTLGLVVATIGFDGARELSYLARGLYAVAAFAALFGSVVTVWLQIASGAAVVLALLYARTALTYEPVRDESDRDLEAATD